MTLYQVDQRKLSDFERAVDPAKPRELEGVNLRQGTWKLDKDHAEKDAVVFYRELPALGVKVLKTYRIERVPESQFKNADYAAYHLTLAVSVENVGRGKGTVAYQLDGPTGLPIEGYWYAAKMTAGLRDVMVKLTNRELATVESRRSPRTPSIRPGRAIR